MISKFLLVISIFLAAASAIKNVDKSKCPVSESTNLSPREYFNSIVKHRGDRHHHFLNKNTNKSRRKDNHHQQAVFDKVLNESSSKHEWKQWQSMYRKILLSGLSADDLPDTLCIFATVLNQSIEIENGDEDREKFDCSFETNFYGHLDLSYRIVKNLLTEKGCSTLNVPTPEIPECYDPSPCVDGGVNFMFEETWQEFNGTMDHLSIDADHDEAREMLSILKPVYDDGDLYGKYVVAITTIIAMEFDWQIKTKLHNSMVLYDFIKSLSIFEEVIESPPDCACEDLESSLVHAVEKYIAKLWDLVNQIKKSHSLVHSQGHVQRLKNKHSKKVHHKN